MIGVSIIDSLFSNIKIANEWTEVESTLARRRPNNLEGENLDEFFNKLGLKRSKL